MLSAINENNEFVLAFNVNKTDGKFFCKGCNSQVLLKKGNIKIHHFSHIHNKDCDFGLGGEGEEHYKIKLALYNFLLKCKANKQILDVELEKNIDGLRADIWFKNNKNQEITIEIQLSPRTKEYIESKIQRYTNKNVATLYITNICHKIAESGWRIRLASWQRYLADMNYSNLYTFILGNNGFTIEKMKLYPSRIRETIFYVNKQTTTNIVKSMKIIKKNNILFYGDYIF